MFTPGFSNWHEINCGHQIINWHNWLQITKYSITKTNIWDFILFLEWKFNPISDGVANLFFLIGGCLTKKFWAFLWCQWIWRESKIFGRVNDLTLSLPDFYHRKKISRILLKIKTAENRASLTLMDILCFCYQFALRLLI